MSLFVLDSDRAPEKVLRSLGEAVRLESRERSRDRLTYLDTFDWRVSQAGLTLAASRSSGGVRLTLLTDDGRVLETRIPNIPDFASDLPPGPFQEVLEPVTRTRRLFPMAEAEWDGALYAVLNEDQKTVVRLVLMEGKAALPGEVQETPIRPRLQLLPLKGYEAEMRAVDSFLRKKMGLRTENEGELSRVLDALGQATGEYSSSLRLELEPDLRADQATKAIHSRLFEIMLANQEGVMEDWDPEFLHDFRVAVRRTRSALTQIKGVFPERLVSHYVEEFRWLGARTGPTRDLDVYLLNIPGLRRALPEDARNDLEPLVRFLEKKKKFEHDRLVRSLKSQRYTRLVKGWTLFLETPGLRDSDLPNAARPIKDVASERIWNAFTKVLRKGRRTGQDTSPEILHRLRINCKKLRYLITFFQSLFPEEELKLVIKELKILQDHLGDFNDLHVQREALKRFAGEMMASGEVPPATLLAMGQLMGQLETRQEIEREAFRKRFKRFSRPRNQARFKKLFRQRFENTPDPEEGKGAT